MYINQIEAALSLQGHNGVGIIIIVFTHHLSVKLLERVR